MRSKRFFILPVLALLHCAVANSQEFPKTETLEVTEVSGNYVLKVPVSNLVMTMPKGGLVPAHNPMGGGARSPRYFYFKDDGQNLIVTGWFEPAEAFRGIKELWAGDSATFKRQGLPEAEDVSFVEIGKWNVIFYDQRLKGMRSSHLRAEWVQAGTWIDLHISITGTHSQAEHRARLRDVLNAIQVTEKPSGGSVAGRGDYPKPDRAGADQGPRNATQVPDKPLGLSVTGQSNTAKRDQAGAGRSPRSINLGGGGKETAAGASDSDPHRTYAVPGHGKMSVLVPAQWKASSKLLQEPPSVLLRFRPPTGDTFYVQVTAVWLDAEKVAKATPDSLKATVQKSSADSLKRSVEKEAKLQELRGEQTIGYYYSLTDRNPPPEEYKYMTQGVSRTGEMMVVFTILQREDSVPERTSALQMLANATYSK